MLEAQLDSSNYTIEDWGLVHYTDAVARQEILLQKIAELDLPGTIVFCTHPPVVTVGRGTVTGDVTSWSGEVVAVTRGGRATYHGPSQLVVYPIINLNLASRTRSAKDIGGLLAGLENAVIQTLRNFGLEARGGYHLKKEASETGVWIGNSKIASVGIAVKKWISYHGVAINLDNDGDAFQGINPCGFSTNTMTSLEKQLGRKINRKLFTEILAAQLRQFI